MRRSQAIALQGRKPPSIHWSPKQKRVFDLFEQAYTYYYLSGSRYGQVRRTTASTPSSTGQARTFPRTLLPTWRTSAASHECRDHG